jgi:DNA-binding transcriptional LysR family regulator
VPRPTHLSLELLRTFLSLVRSDGDAVEAAKRLGVNQPSMSKRLRFLQHAGSVLSRPWLVRDGKTWRLTAEGQKVLPAVVEIVGRYEQLSGFITEPTPEQPQVRFSCGQNSVAGFVRHAIHLFRKEHPEVRVRVATMPGAARIEGVANGSLDLATVTHDANTILEIARRPLFVETIATDRIALVCAEDTPWSALLGQLRSDHVTLKDLTSFPLILPEPAAGIRKGLDQALRQEELFGKLDVLLEIGGWNAILTYVRDGLGVGLVSEAALPANGKLIARYLNADTFAPIAIKLICRRALTTGEELDLAPEGLAFRATLQKAAHKPASTAR